jgi:hypothetical protein
MATQQQQLLLLRQVLPRPSARPWLLRHFPPEKKEEEEDLLTVKNTKQSTPLTCPQKDGGLEQSASTGAKRGWDKGRQVASPSLSGSLSDCF